MIVFLPSRANQRSRSLLPEELKSGPCFGNRNALEVARVYIVGKLRSTGTMPIVEEMDAAGCLLKYPCLVCPNPNHCAYSCLHFLHSPTSVRKEAQELKKCCKHCLRPRCTQVSLGGCQDVSAPRCKLCAVKLGVEAQSLWICTKHEVANAWPGHEVQEVDVGRRGLVTSPYTSPVKKPVSPFGKSTGTSMIDPHIKPFTSLQQYKIFDVKEKTISKSELDFHKKLVRPEEEVILEKFTKRLTLGEWNCLTEFLSRIHI